MKATQACADLQSLSLPGVSSGATQFVQDSNEALAFNLVREPLKEDLEEGQFNPEMTHQIYGENENIFGYRDLRIRLSMSAGSLKSFLSESHSGVIDAKDFDGVDPDPVLPPLIKLLSPGQLAKSEEDFRKEANKEEEAFKPMGEKMTEFKIVEDGASRDFELYYCDHSTPRFLEYHARLQPWIMFFIDAASFLDSDDQNWQYFLMFERYANADGLPRYAIAGYITVYAYYAYPANTRPRISQMLVLPPFQRKGLGAKLLNAVQNKYWTMEKVIDITVEDPADEFIRLRDFVDCTNCLKLSAFEADKLKQGYSPKMHEEANKEFKLGKKQTRRVYEILRLKCTNMNNEAEYKNYRVDIKNRLNRPYQKEERQLQKLSKVLKPEEYAAATINITNREQRMESLQSQYNELEEHYLKIVERLA